jgi:ribose 5-phosphate isomerase A
MNFKQQAARQALEYVQNGMVLGLGTGSTTAYFTDLLAERLQTGSLHDIQVVPTSEASAARARSLNIRITSLSAHERSDGVLPLDLAVDGADEVDPDLNLIKGLGRALLREKVVVVHAAEFVVIVDDSKLVSRLGSRGPLPVEIIPYQAEAHIHWLNSLGGRAVLWRESSGDPVVTDNGNYLALFSFEAGIPDPPALARALADRPGIVEHGMFLKMASRAVVAGKQGVRVLYATGRGG